MRRSFMALAPLVVLAGCAKLGEILKGVDIQQATPKVSFDQMKLKGIDFQGADVAFIFDVANPHPFDVTIDGFSWDLDLAGTDFLAGTEDKGLGLAANGTTKVRLPVHLGFQDIISTANVLKGTDEVPFTLGGDFTFQTKFGPLTLPYQTNGVVPVLKVPKIKLKTARVASLQLLQNKATIEVDLGLSHEQGKALTFQGLDYKLAFAGKDVADGLVAQVGSVEADGEQVVTLPVNLKLLELGTGIVNTVKNKDKLDVGFGASVDVVTPWGAIPLAVNESQKLQLR